VRERGGPDDEQQLESFGGGVVERGDFSHVRYVPSEPPKVDDKLEYKSRSRRRYWEEWERPAGRRLLSSAGLALAALLLIVSGVVVAVALHARSEQATFVQAKPTATATLASSTPDLGAVGAGWEAGGPAYAQTIAFAESAPQIAYVCGPSTPGTGSAPISLGVSNDMGRTWKTLGTPATGADCDLTVDPDDAHDVVLVASSCPACRTPPPLAMYRTGNGGTTWQTWELPDDTTTGAQGFAAYQWTWSGSTLYLAPSRADETGTTRLAVSIGKQPFLWVNAAALFAGAPVGATIGGLITGDGAIYVLLQAPITCLQDCTQVMGSVDDGASWTLIAPMDAGRPVSLLQLQSSPRGTTLYGQVFLNADAGARLYVRSTDGGASWEALPAFPDQLVAVDMLQGLNGTLYTELYPPGPANSATGGADPGVYRLAPGERHWTFVSNFPGNAAGPLVVACGADGRPVALWGVAHPPTSAGPVAGLQRHAP
jgi:hypothetical protein